MDKLDELILQAVGEASLCWTGMPTGVFDEEKAIDISKKLSLDIKAIMKGSE